VGKEGKTGADNLTSLTDQSCVGSFMLLADRELGKGDYLPPRRDWVIASPSTAPQGWSGSTRETTKLLWLLAYQAGPSLKQLEG